MSNVILVWLINWKGLWLLNILFTRIRFISLRSFLYCDFRLLFINFLIRKWLLIIDCLLWGFITFIRTSCFILPYWLFILINFDILFNLFIVSNFFYLFNWWIIFKCLCLIRYPCLISRNRGSLWYLHWFLLLLNLVS